MDVNDYSKDTFELLIFKFLNHSSNAIFYGILAIGVFVTAIFNTTTLYESETFNWGTSTLIMFLMSTIAGLVWWRQAVNRQDYKAILKTLMGDENSETAQNKAEQIMDTVRKYKTTALERLRLMRLSLAMMTSLYLVFISFSISSAVFEPEIKLFDITNIVFYIIGTISLISVIIVNFIIDKKYKKDLLTENYLPSVSETK